jgi:hypothetical protein
MPRKLTIYLGMVGALFFSIASLMNWQAETVIRDSKVYVDEVVKLAWFIAKYTPSIFCLSGILIGMFFINFSWEFGQKKVKVVSILKDYTKNHEEPNTYSTIFKFIGVATIIIGVFVAVYIWSDGMELPKEKKSVFLFGLLPLIYFLVGGLSFMGFGEVLKLLQQIRDRDTKV